MLKIKKFSKLIECKYNLTFLFKKRNISSVYNLKKQQSSSIILRSPKHFNIGKHKIINLNFKTPNLFFKSSTSLFLPSFIFSPSLLYKNLSKRVKTTPTININSIRISIQTKFKLKWLVI